MKSMKVRLNALCLAGALAAVAAMYSDWILRTFAYTDFYGMPVSFSVGWNLMDAIGSFGATIQSSEGFTPIDQGSGFWGPAILFLAGTITAVLTPLGGVVQLTAVALFFRAFELSGNEMFSPGVGLYLGLVAAAVTLTSIVVNVGLTYDSGLKYDIEPVKRSCRLLTILPGDR
ncbi:MAG: hypothetical protein OEM29_01060 [Thermoplasmata archaeon]|nr:hypothetical protein [Thermoplasmata archaeon]